MVTLRIHCGLDTMTNDAKDKFIAPKISRLTAPVIRDISAERKQLLNTFIFNFDLSLVLSNKQRQLLFNIIRKSDDAFDEFCRAAASLKNYVAPPQITLSHYFSAMRHFEHCLAHLYEAVCCMNALARTWRGEKQFDCGDGSILERVHIIHTEIKHMDERFQSGRLGDENTFLAFAAKGDGTQNDAGHDGAGIANVPMWLTNDGLECAKGRLSYEELAEEILEMYREAEKVAKTKPETKKSVK